MNEIRRKSFIQSANCADRTRKRYGAIPGAESRPNRLLRSRERISGRGAHDQRDVIAFKSAAQRAPVDSSFGDGGCSDRSPMCECRRRLSFVIPSPHRPQPPDQVKRLKELEKENERLRKAVSDLTLEKLILREAASGNF
jgi:hypothetical protein